MQDKLASLLERFTEIETQLADPEIAADFRQSQGLMREHATLKPLAELATDYRRVISHTSEMQAMIRQESDKEMVDMARSELSELNKHKT